MILLLFYLGKLRHSRRVIVEASKLLPHWVFCLQKRCQKPQHMALGAWAGTTRKPVPAQHAALYTHREGTPGRTLKSGKAPKAVRRF